ncbi:unnamed protein product [Staurois parvus]|uniref:Uncharacterized protein n=1 Tax=Staurois parvus TaxID=386267 RepID=A0ABN9EZT8_9NEOB|nr:unnamed protein product [Staurois parvus]
MKRSSVFKWHRQFKEEWEDVHNNVRNRQQKTQRMDANVDRWQTLVHSDQILSVRMMAEELNMNRETVQQILLEDLRMRKFSTKMVPPVLTEDQKEHLQISSCLLKNAVAFDFFFFFYSPF